MKKTIILLMVLSMLLGFSVSARAVDEPMIVCENVNCVAGAKITVQITIVNNPGFSYLEMTPQYAEELTLAGVKNGKLFSDFTKGKQYVWVADEDVTEDGLLMTLTFDVAQNAPAGQYAVSFIVRTCGNYNEEPIDFVVQSGIITVKNAQPLAAVYENGVEKAQYSDFGKAVAACGENGYVKLLTDTQVDVTLSKELYVDLNGYDLSGTIATNGYTVYGMDSTTNAYNCENRGIFSCVDQSGAKIVPQNHFKSTITGSVKRYMAVEEQAGYSFHRFYLGVTHMSVRPAVTSVGFKAVFYGDDMVVAELDAQSAFGYSLSLTNGKPVVVYKEQAAFVSGNSVTLRIDNYDIENYGETVLTAKVMLKLSDGTVIESSEVTMTLRRLLENLNNDPTQMTAEQLKAVARMIAKYEILKSWNLYNLVA